MRLPIGMAVATLTLLSWKGVQAQSYSNAVIALNPAGYWPLQETGGPSPAGYYVATNLGTLGASGQGYYQTWWQTNGASNTLTNMNSIVHIAGAIAGDSDTALSQGQIGEYVVIPRTTNGFLNQGVTLTAPFSIEAWIYPTNASANTLKPIIAEGFNNVQATNAGDISTTAGTALGMYSGFLYFVTFNGPNSGTKTEIDAPASGGTLPLNQLYHIVATFNGTTMSLYTNGVLVRSANPPQNTFGQTYVPDPVSPLVIGGGNEPGGGGGASALFGGGIDEVAIYNSALTTAQIGNHWATGTNSARITPYWQVITNDNPAIYLRLDEPAYTGPSAVTAPVASNYGSLGAAANGYYLSGATPGVAGPGYAGFGASSAVALNGFNSVVDIGGGNLPAALNPNNNQPLTVTAWFKGSPADCVARFQTLVGHSAASWRVNLDNNAGLQFNPGNGPQLQFTSVQDELNFGTYVNDGNWHFVAGVADGTNDYLYIDGRLAKSATGVTSVTNGSPQDVILGGDPQYLVPLPISSGGPNRDFDGSIAQVAFFTNALTAAQIQGIYGAAGVPPYFVFQPVSQALYAGTVGGISAVVGGSSPSIQWYSQGGGLLAAQTNSSLTFNPVTTASAGSYYLVATNSYGAVTSAVVRVTVSQPSSYAGAVEQLHPAAYWPLNESNQPPMPLNLTALNLGTLSSAGNGFYGAWYQQIGTTWYLTNNIVQTQAITYPYDGSKGMLCSGSPGQYVIVPRTSGGVQNTNLTIVPPFSVECWVRIGNTNGTLLDYVSEGGYNALNYGGPNPNNPFYGGLGTGWAGFELGQFQDYLFFACNCTNGLSKSSELDTSAYNTFTGFKTGAWVYVVATFDGINEAIYTNSVLCASKAVLANAAGLHYVPDPSTPLMIAGGSEPSAAYGSGMKGTIEDVAIYNEVLPQSSMQNHFQAAYGTNATYGSSYTNAVLADAPILFYRLNDPGVGVASAGYPVNTFPMATNYGSLGAVASGLYQPGTMPGVAGPPYAGFGANSMAVALNGWLGGVDVGLSNLPAALNPTGSSPLTLAAWFRGNMADSPGRWQNLVSHGANSYRLELGTNYVDNRFSPGPASADIGFSSLANVATNGFALNDGNWHMVAGVTDGTNVYLYLDGLLARSTNISGGVQIAGTNLDLLLGGSPDFTSASWNTPSTIQFYDGQIAQVAFFTNALSSNQIQQLYGAAGVPPAFYSEPAASASANAGQSLTISTAARGSMPLVYQWYLTNGTAVTGQTNASLVFNPAATNNSGSYYLVVSNSSGAATSSIVQVTIFGPPVVTSLSPTNVMVFVGTAPVLQFTLEGSSPFYYQWMANGVKIAGATSATYIPSTTTVGSTNYTCLLSNVAGTNYTAPITVAVLSDPTAPYPRAVLSDHPVNYWRLDEGPDNGQGNNGVTAFDYAGGDNGSYSNAMLAIQGYDATTDPNETAVFFGDGGIDPTNNSYAGEVPTFCNFATPSGQNAEFSVEAWAQATSFPGSDSGIVCIGYGFGGEQFCLDNGGNDPAHDVRFYVNDAGGANHGVASGFALSQDSNWHHLVGVCDESNGRVSLYIDGQLAGSTTVAAGAGLRSLTEPLSIGSRMSTVHAIAYDNQFSGYIDDVALYNYALTPTQVLNHYLASGVAPIFTTLTPSSNPNGATWTTNLGVNVTFSVTVEGTAPLSYQWTDNNGNVIAWATNSSITLTNVQQSQDGSFMVMVTNPYGTASTNVYLTVLAGPPQITTDLEPTNQVDYVGTPLSFTVAASGTTPLFYQWYLDGTKIPGATNATYNFSALMGTNNYYVVVSNVQPPVAYSSTGMVVGVSRPALNPADYTYSMKITFPGYTANESLQNFPALVELGTNLPGFSFSQFASPSGDDLRFTDASGTNEIPDEIDQWSYNNMSYIWVSVPSLTSNTTIYAFWGNPAKTLPEAWSTNGGVWVPPSFENLPAYDIVYHLNEGAFPFLDSTLDNTATAGVAPGAVEGIVGAGAGFSGGQFLDCGTNNLGNVFTLSAWVNYVEDGTIETIWANQVGGYGKNGFALWINDYGISDGYLALASGDGTAGNQTGGTEGASPSAQDYVSPGTWHFIEVPVNRTNGTSSFYLDGLDILDSTKVVKDFGTNQDLRLGLFDDANFPMNGIMDEARIRYTDNDANWVLADYDTVINNSTFENYSAIYNSAVMLNCRIINGKAVVSWSPAVNALGQSIPGTLQSASQVTGPYTTVNGATSPYTNSISGKQEYFRVFVGHR